MTKKPNLKSHEKFGLVVFLFIGITTFVLAYMQVKRAIYLPFVRKPIAYKSSDELDQERVDRLKNEDTDKDGLFDYDELYVFRTSPFLADSDSDSILDGAEVAQATDPNCPKGRVCRQTSLSASNGSSPPPAGSIITAPPVDQVTGGSSSASAEERALRAITNTFGDPTSLTKENIAAKLQVMSSAELRTFLVEMGIPEDALQKADDTTLRDLLGDALNEIALSSPGATPTSSTP